MSNPQIVEFSMREKIVRFGQLLHLRGYAPGSSGNISVRLPDGFLVTPTNSCLGLLEPTRIAKLSPTGAHLNGDPPSKEAFLHMAVYNTRLDSNAIVHLHSTHAVGVSCLAHCNAENVLPPITAYHVMRVGQTPLVPYFRPGDLALADAVGLLSAKHHVMLLANHGPVVAGKTLEEAVFMIEELEETAKLWFLLQGHATRFLDAAQIADIQRVFKS